MASVAASPAIGLIAVRGVQGLAVMEDHPSFADQCKRLFASVDQLLGGHLVVRVMRKWRVWQGALVGAVDIPQAAVAGIDIVHSNPRCDYIVGGKTLKIGVVLVEWLG